MVNYYNKINKCFKNKDFKPLIIGEGSYEIVCKHAEVPIDWSVVINFIYSYYKDKNDDEIVNIFRKSLLDLLDANDPFKIWCIFKCLWFLAFAEVKCCILTPFFIIDNQLIKYFEVHIIQNKYKLINSKILIAKNFYQDLWESIMDTSKLLNENYDMNLN